MYDEDNKMAQSTTTDSFNLDWNATDITQLQPGYLTRTRPVRAWERKPASPFAKQRLRVGKVWKRTLPAVRAAPSNATVPSEERNTKRLRGGYGGTSPVKIVKRVCLGANHSVGSQWDKMESPQKRIATRSSAANDLVALPDEEDESASEASEEDIEGTVIEYLNEDGTQLDVDTDEAQANEGWLDVEAADEDLGERTTQAIGVSSEQASDMSGQMPTKSRHHETSDQAPDATGTDAPTSKPHIFGLSMAPPASIPAGFVSPVRRKRPVSRRPSAMPAETGRRRTLPQTFAPTSQAEEPEAQEPTVEVPAEKPASPSPADTIDLVEQVEEIPAANAHEDEAAPSETDDDAWEDVAEEPGTHQLNDLDGEAMNGFETMADATPFLEDAPLSPATSSHEVELPLRRSPRRKSTSPLKQRTFQTFMDTAPHLVAFSPMKKMPSIGDDLSPEDRMDAEVLENDNAAAMMERSASAPPEEPRMSPRRSAKPRVSDDTALLQAFLNRAAENKSTRRLSATKRESLSNRRDSDTVRQALASPAKPEILGALDPNSPSPKKSTGLLGDEKLSIHDEALVTSPVQSAGDSENCQGRSTRRSHRDKRRIERAAPLAHTKISLRGNTEPVVLKRSEAQELATLTRSNTRKNKGGSLMPPLRLSKLISEKPPIEESPEEGEKPPGGSSRNVKWDETLAYYQEAPSEPEVQLFELGDSNTAPKLQGNSASLLVEPENDEGIPAPPPAAETPSKPKVRKLKASRSASTPRKSAAAPVTTDEIEDAPQPAPKQRQPRRSRIATPAKGSDPSALLPAAAQPAPAESIEAASRPKAMPRKKAAASRLPAPASLAAASQEAQSLIASPPKKKPASGGPPTKNFAPKLDFQTKLGAPAKTAEASSEGISGLMSPAKRAGKSFALSNPPAAPIFGAKAEQKEDKKVPGLSSPAKKRSRRLL